MSGDVTPGAADAAVEVVARHILALAADEPEWGDFPDIGEHDWKRVCDRLAEIAAFPAADDFIAAYTFLTARASGDGVL